MTRGLNRTHALLLALGIFLLNAWICRDLFSIGFMRNLDSNEGAFVSIARFYRDFGFFERWFPWFNCGMPIENAYQPLLPMSVALLSKLSGWSLEHAFHFFMAVVYCAGPVTLFWFILDYTESWVSATAAAVFYSLWSPAQWVIPILHVDAPLRLYNIVHYAEDPHNLALTVLPLALLYLRRRRLIPAVLFCAAVVLSNAFGAVDLAIGGLCIVIAERRGAKHLLLAGITAWCLISPWLPPSLIHLIAHDQWNPKGAGLQLGALVLIALAARITKRFEIPFAIAMCAIPALFFHKAIALVPQANRYQLELQLSLSMLCGRLVSLPSRLAVPALAGLLVVSAAQIPKLTRASSERIQPLEITQTTQYKTNEYLTAHYPNRRTMVAGDAEFLYNLTSNNPQLSGGHEPTVPNWSERVAIYAFYAGAPNPADAVLWLKAFGAQALSTPAADPKFKNYLPLKWTGGTTNIYEIPTRSQSQAHVIPTAAEVKRQPIHSLDVGPLKPYVAALDDVSLPEAQMQGEQIETHLTRNQSVSVQLNYAPGWQATANGRRVPVTQDAIGLIAIHPNCEGDCHITLHYGVSAEAWLCRILSLLAAVFLIAKLLFANRRRTSGAPPQPFPDLVSAR